MSRTHFKTPVPAISCCLLTLSLLSCVSRPINGPAVAIPSSKHVSMMTYNVENLFDTEDDPEKNDDTYLPLSDKKSPIHQNKCRYTNSSPGRLRECLSLDWSPAVLDRKLRRLTDVVSQVNNGRGPDVLIVQEVESRIVLEKWRSQYMNKMGYNTLVYIRGPDERGINPAILSRLPLIGDPRLYPIDLSVLEEHAHPTRGILEATLELPIGEPLTVFAVHFPSQGAPTDFRRQAVRTLIDIATTLPPDSKVVVGGDFNISAQEEYKERFFADLLSHDFGVSHLIGCKDCVGTIYFPPDKTWSFFDVLLFSRNLVPQSIHIVNSSVYQTRRDGTPARFGNGHGSVGVSDHWPMYAEIEL